MEAGNARAGTRSTGFVPSLNLSGATQVGGPPAVMPVAVRAQSVLRERTAHLGKLLVYDLLQLLAPGGGGFKLGRPVRTLAQKTGSGGVALQSLPSKGKLVVCKLEPARRGRTPVQRDSLNELTGSSPAAAGKRTSTRKPPVVCGSAPTMALCELAIARTIERPKP